MTKRRVPVHAERPVHNFSWLTLSPHVVAALSIHPHGSWFPYEIRGGYGNPKLFETLNEAIEQAKKAAFHSGSRIAVFQIVGFAKPNEADFVLTSPTTLTEIVE